MNPDTHEFKAVRRHGLATAAAVLFALALPASALAQAPRTWVSGVGDDASPCSRTAPCKTFAGAISKTAAGGEVSVLDPGGFGNVTITKAITINGDGFDGGVLSSGTNGIVVAAGASDRVSLINLDINGTGNGLTGVKILSAGNVAISDSQISGFTTAGVFDAPSSGTTRVEINDSSILNNTGDGVVATPASTAKVVGTLYNDRVENNNCGAVAAAYGGAAGSGANCGVSSGSGAAGKATLNVLESVFADNSANSTSAGLFAEGTSSTIRAGQSKIIGNWLGLAQADGGTITSFGENDVGGNANDGSFSPAKASPSSKATARKHHHKGKKSHKAHHRPRTKRK